MSIMLLLIMEYYFAILGFIFLDNQFNVKGANCDTFWRCYFIVYDWTFKATGSLGARIEDPETKHL